MQFLLELDYSYLMYTMRRILRCNLYFLNWKDWKQISKGRKGDAICFLFEKNNNVIDKLLHAWRSILPSSNYLQVTDNKKESKKSMQYAFLK